MCTGVLQEATGASEPGTTGLELRTKERIDDAVADNSRFELGRMLVRRKLNSGDERGEIERESETSEGVEEELVPPPTPNTETVHARDIITAAELREPPRSAPQWSA